MQRYLTIQFLRKTEDVTSIVLAEVKDNDNDSLRKCKIDTAINHILKPYEKNDFINARVGAFYSKNKYYLLVYDVFKDIRLVLTPPTSMGKYGGVKLTIWMWPRHTCDFSVFRVYANKDNKPARIQC